MTIGTDVWLSLAIQIPVVLLFCIFMGYIVKLFLAHATEQEERSRAFIKEQRESNNEAIKDMAAAHRDTLERLTDSLSQELSCLADKLQDMSEKHAGHDAFVRTAFRERFGMATMTNAEQAAETAAAQAARK
jgi:hypothetical protein